MAQWLAGRVATGLVEPDELTQRCCETLEGLLGLVAELRLGFTQRRQEILDSLAAVNQQDHVTRNYERSLPGVGVSKGAPKQGRPDGHNNGFRSRAGPRTWSPGRLALYK